MASKKSAKNRGKPQQKATKPPAEEEMPLEIEEAPAVEVSDMKTAEKREKDKGKKKTGGAMAWIRKADPIAMTCFTVFILAFVVVTASYINTMYIAEPPAQHMIVNGDSVEVEYTGSYFAYYDKDGAVDTSWGTNGSKTGKTLSVGTADVDTKATFMVVVEL